MSWLLQHLLIPPSGGGTARLVQGIVAPASIECTIIIDETACSNQSALLPLTPESGNWITVPGMV